MLKFGYGGKILRINLSTRTYKTEELQKSWIRDVIGGRAANSKRLYEEIDPGCDPLGPDNMLIFGIGPLTGSILPASAYYTISAKSPLTNILGDSAAGGQFGAEMKLTGFDQIIITGKSDSLIYLDITNDSVQFTDASHLKHKSIFDTTKLIREDKRDFAVQVACIGRAGENKVLYSSVVSSGNRKNGRTGMGAVMGSKNLKAIALKGKGTVKYADPLGLMELVSNMKTKIYQNEEYDKRYQMGTTMLMNDLNSIGILPTNHFKEGVYDSVDKVSGEKLAEVYKVKNKACFNCNLHCSRYYMTDKVEAEGPEYETLCSFSSKIGNDDLEFALEMNHYLNQNGLDSISAGEAISWLIECQERGIIKPEDVGGFQIKWGEKDKIRELLEMIVNRNGIGNKLAEGATKFSKSFSKEARDLVMQVKGLDIICGDPRGIKAYGLTYAIASRGADHLRAEPYFELTGKYDLARQRFGTEKAADRLAEDGKAALVTWSEKIALLTDSLTMCKNIGLCMDVLDFEDAAKLLTLTTGIKYTASYLEMILGKAIETDYRLNLKFGLSTDQDTLPDRFTKEPLTSGKSRGSVVDIEKMVSEYRAIHNRE